MNKLLFLILISSFAHADIQYSWDIPTQRVDGTPLDVAEISHYVIEYIGAGGGPATIQTATGADTSYIVTGISTATAKIATVDVDGQQGPWSESVSCSAAPAMIILRCEIVK